MVNSQQVEQVISVVTVVELLAAGHEVVIVANFSNLNQKY